MTVIEANLDDMNPEHYPPVTERLFQAGALDVTLAPLVMKKGRPGTLVSVLAPPEKSRAVVDILLRETSDAWSAAARRPAAEIAPAFAAGGYAIRGDQRQGFVS